MLLCFLLATCGFSSRSQLLEHNGCQSSSPHICIPVNGKKEAEEREKSDPSLRQTSQNPQSLFPRICLGRASHESQENREDGKGSPLTGYPAAPDKITFPFLRRKGMVDVGWVPAVSRRHSLSRRKERLSRWSPVCVSSICTAILRGRGQVSGRGLTSS